MTEPTIPTNLLSWKSWIHGCEWGYRPIPCCGLDPDGFNEITKNAQEEFLRDATENEPIIHLEVH